MIAISLVVIICLIRHSSKWCLIVIHLNWIKQFLVVYIRQVFRSFNELCSAELFGTKFFIPCNPVDVLIDSYGKIDDWKQPKRKGYKLNAINFRKWLPISDSLKSSWVKYYDKYGRLVNKKKPIKKIHRWIYFNIKIDKK